MKSDLCLAAIKSNPSLMISDMRVEFILTNLIISKFIPQAPPRLA